MKNKILTITLTLILMLVFATPALADGPEGAKVIFGENFTLEAEESVDDLVVFGGNVSLEADSTVNGDMVVFGGNVTLDGTVEGDIGLIGGNVNVGETAVVEGDIGLVGGHANIAEKARIDGEVHSVTELDLDYGGERDQGEEGFIVPPTPPIPDFSNASFRGPDVFGWIGDVIKDIFWNISLIITLGLISWLVAAFMPEQMMNVRRTVTDSTAVSFGLGLMTSVVALVFIPIAALLLITICLAIFPIAAYALMGVGMLFGWIVIGQLIGERLLSSNGRQLPSFVLSTLVGVTVLTIVTNMPVIGEVPFLGFLLGLVGSIVGLVVVMTGLGSVLLTRFGTRSYPTEPSYAYAGGSSPSPSYSSGGGGSRVRWTDPAPDVSEEAVPASESELNAKIKAALAKADKANQSKEPVDESPEDDEPNPEA